MGMVGTNIRETSAVGMEEMMVHNKKMLKCIMLGVSVYIHLTDYLCTLHTLEAIHIVCRSTPTYVKGCM